MYVTVTLLKNVNKNLNGKIITILIPPFSTEEGIYYKNRNFVGHI